MTPTTTQPNTPERRLEGLAARVERYAMLLVVVLLAAVAFGAATAADPGASRIGGDYPAFYAAGDIVLSGDVDDLYDPGRQATAQAPLLPEDGAYLYFAYPPPVAALYVPLAALDYRWSLVVHSVLMAVALYAAVRLAGRWFPFVASRPWLSFAGALFFYPMLRAVIGGQNTAITLLLVVVAARFDDAGWYGFAGLAAAGLLYKPQFGVPLAVLLLVAGRWRSLAGWTVGAAAWYAAGAALFGLGWVATWWDSATTFASLNVAANGELFISVPGVLAHLTNEAPVATFLGVVWALVVGAAVAWIWWVRRDQPLERWAAAVAGLVAVLPQPLFYEAGLLLLPLAVAVQATGWAWLGVAVWVFGAAQVAAPAFGFSPLVALSVLASGVVLRRAWELRPQEVPA